MGGTACTIHYAPCAMAMPTLKASTAAQSTQPFEHPGTQHCKLATLAARGRSRRRLSPFAFGAIISGEVTYTHES